MKKRLSLVLAVLGFCVALGATAQDRKSWDFTKGLSAETTANLKADSSWKDSGETDTEADGTPRSWTNANKITETISFVANGVEIEELAGLKLTTSGVSSNSDFRIGVQTETLRPIMGLPDGYGRFRLCRANMELVLPALKAGQKVQVDFMSAAPSDKGGGRYLKSDQMTVIDGAPAGDAYVDLTRYVVTFQVNDDIVEPTEIILKSTNGVDIFSINIDGGGGVVEEAKKVAFVSDDADNDVALMLLQGDSRLDVTPLNANDAAVTLADLQGYEAVIVSNVVAADSKIVPVLKSAIAYEPMVNLNAALYEAWGLGKAVTSDAQSVTMTDAFAADETFASIANGDALLSAGTLSTIELGDYFADDAVVATIDGKVAIHRHNAGRNAYINIPLSADYVPTFSGSEMIISDLAVYAASTKREVVGATAPKIEQKNGDMETTVTITAAAGSVIHYTLDGAEPTVESPVYTEPLVLTEAKTVKAMAELDGYLPSAVASAEVVIMSKVATPTFDMIKDETSTTVTIECATPGAAIYYSYREFTDTLYAQKYVEPITLSQEPTPIYAMAAAENCVLSDLAEDYVVIKSLNKNTIRMDTVSHFSASEAAWMPATPAEGSSGAAKAHYYWGKNAWAHYTDEIDHYEDGVDADNNPTQVPVYKPDPAARKVMQANEGTENDWMLVSEGQVLVGELTSTAGDGVGEPTGAVLAGRYADTAEDLIGGLSTKGMMSFKGSKSGDPLSASIESTKAFKAPFDVVVYIGNGNKDNKVRNGELQISKDGTTWEKASDLAASPTVRYIKRHRVSINDEGDYYVRVAKVPSGLNIGDIYILNNGEVSQKYDPESGIEDVEVAEVEVVRTEIYNISGMLMPEMIQGINIVRTYYSDGSVKTTKVLNR